MGVIFDQLGHLFLQAIPTVILVFLLFVILDRIFFRPVMAVLKQREELTVGALARAREQATAAGTKTREYEEAFQAARQEIYRQREADRRTNLEQRDAALRKAREQADVLIREAQATLATEVDRAKAELDAACQPLAEEISESLVGPETTPGGQGRLRL
ncbi:MAG TPA: ATP synthase F0 subunit B [Terriglobia bacterium]|nr:ATP synthase F0 subunit B [Terriglobia bacterium]